MQNIVISHSDADGILSVAMFLKKINAQKVYFTSPARLIRTIGNSIYVDGVKNNLYIFDISGNKLTIKASSLFNNAIWIDHHEWEENLEYVKNFENVKAIVDPKASSAASVVAQYFNVSSNLLKYADEIDTNNIKSVESERILYITESFRAEANWHKMLEFAKKLANNEDEIYNPAYDKIIEDRKIFINKAIEFAKKNVVIEKIGNIDIGIIETDEMLPVSKVYDNIKCDIFVAIMFQNNTNNHVTKIELRSNKINVYTIAKELGGGGHKCASGATLEGKIGAKDILEKIKTILEQNETTKILI